MSRAHQGSAKPASVSVSKRVLWRALLPIGLMAGIAIASHRPLPVDLGGDSDKLVHFAAYAVLAGTWFWALRGGARRGMWIVAAAISAVWGVLDEWHQSFVPGRHASVLDALADVAGALGGALAYRVLSVRWARPARSGGGV